MKDRYIAFNIFVFEWPGDVQGEGEDGSAGLIAWRLLGVEAWHLLDSGQLRSAARLGAALSAVGGSMPALLLSCRPPDRPQPNPASVIRGVAIQFIS